MMKAAVIPCYNEERHISEVVRRTAQYVDHIVVVDDGSNEPTRHILADIQEPKLIILQHLLNLGKGAAVRTGCDYATRKLKADLLILIDGDMQHDPDEIPQFLETQHATDAGIVFGMRKRTDDMPTLMQVGNWFLTTTSRVLFGIGLEDSQCGYRLLTASAYKKVRWESSDYGMESEMIVRAGVKKIKHKEILVKTIYHDKYKGTGIMDGVKILIKLVKWRLVLW